MNNEQFVAAIKDMVKQTVDITTSAFSNPSGRRPNPERIKRAEWFNNLSEKDKEYVKEAIYEAANFSLVGWLCVLDGSTFLEDSPEKGRFDLYFTKNGEKVWLNDPSKEELLAIYTSE